MLASSRDVIAKLQADTRHLREKATQSEEYARLLIKKTEVNGSLTSDNRHLREQLLHLTAELDQTKNFLTIGSLKLQTSEEGNASLRVEAVSRTHQIERQTCEINELREMLASAEAEMKAATQRMSELIPLEARYLEAHQSIKDKDVEIARFKTSLDEVLHALMAEKCFNDLQQENLEPGNEKDMKDKSLSELSEAFNATRDELGETRVKLAIAQHQVAESEEKVSRYGLQMEQMSTVNISLQEELAKKIHELDIVSRELHYQTERLSSSEMATQRSEELLRSHISTPEKISSLITGNLEQVVSKLKFDSGEDIAMTRRLGESNCELRAETEALHLQLGNVRKELANTKEELERARRELQESHEKVCYSLCIHLPLAMHLFVTHYVLTCLREGSMRICDRVGRDAASTCRAVKSVA